MLNLTEGTTIGYRGREVAKLVSPIHLAPQGLTLLVGRNGQGKSTLLKYLCNCLEARPPRSLRTVYLPEELDFDGDLTPATIARAALDDVTNYDRSKLLAELTVPWRELSKGTKQKARVLMTLANAKERNVELLCLDEPFSGLDYSARRVLWGLIGEMTKNRHVILSLHPEAIRQQPDNVIAVNKGRVWRMDLTNNPSWVEIEESIDR